MNYNLFRKAKNKPRNLAYHAAFMVAIIIAVIVRLSSIGYSPWFDEFASVWFSRRPISLLWTDWMVRETNPPLYYSLLSIWRGIFGDSLLSWRGLSVTASIACLILIYKFVTKFWDRRSAVISVFLAALSAQHLHYAHEMRAYIFVYLGILISIIGFFGLSRSIEDRVPRPYSIALYVFGATFAIYCHTTAIFWPLSATIALIIVHLRNIMSRPLLFAELFLVNMIIALLSSWWLWVTFIQISTPQSNISWIQPIGFMESFKILAKGLLLAQAPGLSFIMTASAIIFSIVAILPRMRSDRAIRLLIMTPTVAVTIFWLAQFHTPVFLERTLFWISIFSLVGTAIALASIRNTYWRTITTTAILSILTANLIMSSRELVNENWTDAMAAVKRDPKAVLLVDGEGMSIAANIACELNGDKNCPFPVKVLKRRGADMDRWAVGMGHSDQISALQITQNYPESIHLYIYRRFGHDPLNEFHRLKLLQNVRSDGDGLVGPIIYSPTARRVRTH